VGVIRPRVAALCGAVAVDALDPFVLSFAAFLFGVHLPGHPLTVPGPPYLLVLLHVDLP